MSFLGKIESAFGYSPPAATPPASAPPAVAAAQGKIAPATTPPASTPATATPSTSSSEGFLDKLEGKVKSYGQDVSGFAKDHPWKFAVDTALTVLAVGTCWIPGAGEAVDAADAAVIGADIAGEGAAAAAGEGAAAAAGEGAAAAAGEGATAAATEGTAAAATEGTAAAATEGTTAAATEGTTAAATEGTTAAATEGTAETAGEQGAADVGEQGASSGNKVGEMFKKAHNAMETTTGKVLQTANTVVGYGGDVSGTPTGEKIGMASAVVGLAGGLAGGAGTLLEGGGRIDKDLGNSYLGGLAGKTLGKLKNAVGSASPTAEAGSEAAGVVAKGASAAHGVGAATEGAEGGSTAIGAVIRGGADVVIDGTNMTKGAADVHKTAKEQAEERAKEAEAEAAATGESDSPDVA